MILPSAVADEETSAVVQESVTASQDLDYTAMNLFMERVSKTERGRPSIAYKIVRENGSEFLDEYEVYLSGIDSTALSDDERLAYWLNVQNFLVVKAVTLDTKTTKLKSLRGTGAKPGKMWFTVSTKASKAGLAFHQRLIKVKPFRHGSLSWVCNM